METPVTDTADAKPNGGVKKRILKSSDKLPLDNDVIYEAMRQYLEDTNERFNPELLRQYVNMRLPVIKGVKKYHAKFKRRRPHDPKTMTGHTIKTWCMDFLSEN